MRTAPGRRDEVIAILTAAVEGLGDAGCSLYVVGRDDTDPDLIQIYELWESAGHHAASLDLPATQEAISKAMPMLAGEFTSVEGTLAGGLGV